MRSRLQPSQKVYTGKIHLKCPLRGLSQPMVIGITVPPLANDDPPNAQNYEYRFILSWISPLHLLYGPQQVITQPPLD